MSGRHSSADPADPSSNPNHNIYAFVFNNLKYELQREKNKNKQKEAGIGPYHKNTIKMRTEPKKLKIFFFQGHHFSFDGRTRTQRSWQAKTSFSIASVTVIRNQKQNGRGLDPVSLQGSIQ